VRSSAIRSPRGYAYAPRRLVAGLFALFLVLAPASPVIVGVAASAGTWSSIRGWDGAAVVVASAAAAALNGLLVLLVDSFLLGRRSVTLGMALTGLRLEGGGAVRRFAAPTLAVLLPVMPVVVAYPWALDVASTYCTSHRASVVCGVRDCLQSMSGADWFDVVLESVAVPLVLSWLVLLNAVTMLVSKRTIVDWIAGGTGQLAPPVTSERRSGWGGIDYLLLLGSALPTIAGALYARGDGIVLLLLAVSALFSVGGYAAAQVHSLKATQRGLAR
jgi:hypothetical protein